ncbi:MAG: aminoglycoside phosphotransferase family protein [Gemmatimonadetes bacterium]|nr:aminoglycoside phosphotransferase family protein [Gemmatimonadota bacterium]
MTRGVERGEAPVGARPSEEMLELVERVVRRLPGRPARVEWEILYRDEHSNDVAEVHFSDDRILYVKRALGPEGRKRCRTSTLASRLLRERTRMSVPRYLEIDPPLDEPVLAYWQIRHDTLDSTVARWPPGGDRAVLESFGRLVRRIHRVRLPGHGPLTSAELAFATHLEADLTERLRPAVYGEWPAATETLECLLDVIRRYVRGSEPPAVLVHNDLHAENILCRVVGDSHRCVGAIDLEDCFAGPIEADLAKVEVLHGPLFGQGWPQEWLQAVFEGYGPNPELFRIGVFRTYHLLNLGFHAALIGYPDHAARVAEAAARELESLGTSLPHAEVVQGLAG